MSSISLGQSGSGPPEALVADWLSTTRSEVLSGVASVAARLLHARVVVMYMGTAERQQLIAHLGLPVHGKEVHVPEAVEALCLESVHSGSPVTRDRLCAVTEPDPAGSSLSGGFTCVPFGVGGTVQGALGVLASEPRCWTSADLEGLEILAQAVAAELERSRLLMECQALVPALRRSESRYLQLTQRSPYAVVVIDRRRRITEVNAVGVEISGRPLDRLVGCDFRELLAPEDRGLVERHLRARRGDASASIETELRILRPTGERRLLQASIIPVVERGRVVNIQGVARDITEERAREMQLRRAERLASVAPLIGGICHELNNPLTSIKSFTELLLLDPRSPEDQEALEIVRGEADRAAKIVADLRVVARRGEDADPERGPVDLNEIVSHVLRHHREELEAAQVQVRADLASDLPPIWGSRAQVQEIMQQLTRNALQVLQERTGVRRLDVRTFPGSSGVALQVEDNGPGISAENLEHIFDPFWTTRGPTQGTGLGLSLVQGIVTEHGGTIRVDSAPGRGAEFLIELPVAEKAPAVAGKASQTRLRVLVVDDEPAIRYSVARYLERRGHRVDEAEEGNAALRLLDGCALQERYDLILADLRMPGLDGGQLLSCLRERGDGLEGQLVFMTGDAEGVDLESIVQTEGVPVVQKPFELAELAQILESHAGVQSSRPMRISAPGEAAHVPTLVQ